MLRDMFAISLLEKGISLETVSILLGHYASCSPGLSVLISRII